MDTELLLTAFAGSGPDTYKEGVLHFNALKRENLFLQSHYHHKTIQWFACEVL